MIKKYLPYLLITSAVVVLIMLLSTIHSRNEQGLGIMHPTTVSEAVISILLMTVGIALLLKRL